MRHDFKSATNTARATQTQQDLYNRDLYYRSLVTHVDRPVTQTPFLSGQSRTRETEVQLSGYVVRVDGLNTCTRVGVCV